MHWIGLNVFMAFFIKIIIKTGCAPVKQALLALYQHPNCATKLR